MAIRIEDDHQLQNYLEENYQGSVQLASVIEFLNHLDDAEIVGLADDEIADIAKDWLDAWKFGTPMIDVRNTRRMS